MFCTNCGKELDDGVIVCGYCAAPVDIGQQKPLRKAYPKDDKFNFFAFFFGVFWLLAKGMWDALIISVIIEVVFWQVLFTDFVSTITLLLLMLMWWIFWGRNGNYYSRIKKEKNILFVKAFLDPQLRRF